VVEQAVEAGDEADAEAGERAAVVVQAGTAGAEAGKGGAVVRAGCRGRC